MTNQCVNTKGSKEEAKYHESPLGWAREVAQTHQQMLQVSPRELGGMLNMTRILWSNSFALIRTI